MEVTGALFHRTYCQRNIATTGKEDDRDGASLSIEVRLQLNTRHAWHLNVNDEASNFAFGSRTQKLLSGTETQRRHALRLDQILQGSLN
jgi:hypothetical protein